MVPEGKFLCRRTPEGVFSHAKWRKAARDASPEGWRLADRCLLIRDKSWRTGRGSRAFRPCEPRPFAQILDQAGESRVARRFVAHAQDRRWMDSGEAKTIVSPVQASPPLAHKNHLAPHQGLRRRGAKRDDKLRPCDGELTVEPPAAPLHLIAIRLPVDTLLAARLEFEMLDRVGNKNRGAVEAGLHDGAVERPAGRPHERPPGEVFVVAGLLTHGHDFARPGPSPGTTCVVLR